MTRRFDFDRLGTIADVLITAIVFTTSLWMGIGALRELAVNTISYTLPVAAMSACGQGLTSPGSISPDFAAFAKRERPSITCDAVIGGSAPSPPDPFSMTYRYAIYSVAAAMRILASSATTPLPSASNGLMSSSRISGKSVASCDRQIKVRQISSMSAAG